MWRYLVVVSMLAGVPARAQDAGRDWQWLRSVEDCALIQKVAQSKDAIILSVYPGSGQSWIMIADSRLRAPASQKLPSVHLTLKPGRSVIADAQLYPASNISAPGVSIPILHHDFVQDFAKVTEIAVSHPKLGFLVQRQVHSAADATRALVECENAMLREWGIDPAYWRGLRERPIPLKSLHDLFSSEDYPPGYLLNAVEGKLILRLIVGTDGRVEQCTPVNRRADKYFFQKICGKLKIAARFQPAVDFQGRVVKAPYITGARFAIER
ncbi:MAG TPA: hypothetical protein VM308_06275 [Sphingomicrobium sp.]|nr:hypothetical protein [Sphingomicrobium sp.]